LCLENTAVPITFKEALTLFETLRFECWNSSFEHFVFFRFVFFVGKIVDVTLDVLKKYSYWFFWHQNDFYFEDRLWCVLFQFLCFLKFSIV
jgi:hypothetical protein